MSYFDGVAHIELEKILHGVDAHHHDQAGQKHPGKVWITARVEVEQAQDTNGCNSFQDYLLHITADLHVSNFQYIPQGHYAPYSQHDDQRPHYVKYCGTRKP